MILGKVVGTIVCSTKNDCLSGARYLLVDKCNQQGNQKGDYLVALDLVGAGNSELVMVSEGSSARETQTTLSKPVDAVIVGIIDSIEENETVVYKK
jgi:microcompartment protein CcmK/EutM